MKTLRLMNRWSAVGLNGHYERPLSCHVAVGHLVREKIVNAVWARVTLRVRIEIESIAERVFGDEHN